MFDITELPDKYTFNQESLSEEKYIDDNSLFVYFCISRGLFNNPKDSQISFIYFNPFEWTSVDFIAFLLSVCSDYGLNITNIKTMVPAIEDEYEVSHKPRRYKGAYKWILDLRRNEPEREEVKLFDKLSSDTASIADLERALIYASRIAPLYKDEKSQLYLSKDLFRNLLSYTSFCIEPSSTSKNKLKANLDTYLEEFMQEKLTRDSKSKTIGNTSVSQSKNIFTFKKHRQLFGEYLQRMQNDFGNTMTIENIFEERFPNLRYPDSETIRKRYSERNFYFIHILLTFHKQGLLKILSLGSNWDYHEDEMYTYQAKIEILPAFLNENVSNKLHFDLDKSRLYVQGKEFKLLKFKDEYHTLRVMFEDVNELGKEWFFSEIAERIDENRLDDKKYYNAIYQIRLKLEKQGINDFFITTKQSVKINKKYLS
ncbi:MAG: hypothetical protein HYW77_00670 [Parcubacteria group bacterium]|nr:hypothetical protein [Parcubacteria group bacterium]